MKLLLIADPAKGRRMHAWGFSPATYDVKFAHSPTTVSELLEKEPFHIACIDWKMRCGNAGEITAMLQTQLPTLPVIALVGEKDLATKPAGLVSTLVSPVPIETLHAALRTHALTEAPASLPSPPRRPAETSSSDVAVPFVSSDQTAARMYELALRAAKSSAAILILGETGTGKSRLARAIHQQSPLQNQPFVTVNCPCLNHALLESELFGHTRGSFTGAIQDTWGKVAAADGGTLFLDEIGELPMVLQPKLLRVLQEKQYERIGETKPRSANVRVIAATNRDLKREVAAGRFREDLYYRLNVIAVDVPPLRGRPAQIIAAAEEFLDSICGQIGKTAPAFGASARRLLECHTWPGNLRELRNLIERAAILSSSSTLEAEDFPELLTRAAGTRYQVGEPISLQALENAHIEMVVANSGSLEEAARILEIDKSTLYRKRKQMESRVAQFTSGRRHPAPIAVAAGL
jgi:NtrC-family two-component system response regulator AlgB